MAQLDRQELNDVARRAAQGERACVRRVCELLWPVVQRFAAGALADDALGADVAQRTLVRLCEQLPEYQPDKDALAWALEVAKWECRTERTRARRARLSGLDAAGGVAAAQPAADDTLSQQQLAQGVAQAMTGLSAADQLELERLLADAPSGDAAGRKRRQRALERLRAVWRSLHGDE